MKTLSLFLQIARQRVLYAAFYLFTLMLIMPQEAKAVSSYQRDHFKFGSLVNGQLTLEFLLMDNDGQDDELDRIKLYYLDPKTEEWVHFFEGDCAAGDDYEAYYVKEDRASKGINFWGFNGEINLKEGQVDFFIKDDDHFNGSILFKVEADWDESENDSPYTMDFFEFYEYKNDVLLKDWEDYSDHSFDQENSEVTFDFLITYMYGQEVDGIDVLRHELDDVVIQYQDADGDWHSILHGDCDNDHTLVFEVFDKDDNLSWSQYSEGSCYYTRAKWIIPVEERGRVIKFKYTYQWDEGKSGVNVGPIVDEDFEVQSYYSGGLGTEESPYLIRTASDFIYLSQTSTDWSMYFVQIDDILFDSAEDWNGDGTLGSGDDSGFSPIGNTSTQFTGVYNGDGYSISGLSIDIPSTESNTFVGMFGYVSDSKILNLSLIEVDVKLSSSSTDYVYVGGVVGFADNSDIEQCSSSGACYVLSTSSKSPFVGGLVGYAKQSSIKNSFSTSSVFATAASASSINVGGLLGKIKTATTVINCYSTGRVEASCATTVYVGGFIGYSDDGSSVKYCYSTGFVEAYAKSSSYSLGGGFIGQSLSTTISACYYDKDCSGMGSIAVYGKSKTNVSPYTADQFKAMKNTTVASWAWQNDIGANADEDYPWVTNAIGRPYLYWQDVAVSNGLVDGDTNNGCQISGSVVSASGISVSEKGFLYQEDGGVWQNDISETSGVATNSITSIITGLTTGDTIYAQAYAKASNGHTYYGDMISFVAKGVPSLVINNEEVVFSKTAVAANVSKVPSSAVVYYRPNGSGGAWSTSKPINVGVYDVKLVSDETDDYYSAVKESNSSLIITAKPVTVTADAKSVVYGESEVVLTYQSTALAGDDSFSGSLQRAAGTDVGSYEISQGSLTAGSNYDITYIGADYDITAKPVTVTADPKSVVYGESEVALTYESTSLVDGDSFSGSLQRTAGTDAGTYEISQGSLAAGSNYDITYIGADYDITAKPVTVTADAKSLVYGESDVALSYQATSLVDGDSFSGGLQRSAGTDIGTYAILQGSLSAGANYDITYLEADYDITPKPVTITADDKFSVYGESDVALTYQSASLVDGDSFFGNLQRSAGADTGIYAIAQGTLTAGDNYSITYISGNYTITTVEDNCLKFDGDDDYIQLDNGVDIGNSSSTMELLVKIPKAGDSNLGSNERVGVILGCFGAVINFNYEIHDDGQLRIFWNNGATEVYGTTDLRDNQWHHIAIVRDIIADKFLAYIDGEIEMENDGAGANISLASIPRVGADLRSDNGGPNFHGLMDEFRIWQVAKTQEQIKEQMYLSVLPTSSDLLTYFNFDEGIGSTLDDQTAANNSGKLTHMDTPWLKYSGGSGTTDAPYEIARVKDLISLSQTSDDWDKSFVQTIDIDFDTDGDSALIDEDWNGDGELSEADNPGFSPIGNEHVEFAGSYIGNYCNITGLYIDIDTEDVSVFAGLFGKTNDASIHNVALRNTTVEVRSNTTVRTASLIGHAENTEIRNCYTEGAVSVELSSTEDWPSVGGMVGFLTSSSTIDNSYASVNVYAKSADTYAYSGGLVGFSDGSSVVTNCYANGLNEASSPLGTCVGGLVAYNEALIKNSYATGVSLSSNSSHKNTGGLIGYQTGEGANVYYSYYDNDSYTDAGDGAGIGLSFDEFKSMSDNESSPNDFSQWNWQSEKGVEENDDYPWVANVEGRPYLYWQQVAVSNGVAIGNVDDGYTIEGYVVYDNELSIMEKGVRYKQKDDDWQSDISETTGVSVNSIKSVITGLTPGDTVNGQAYVHASDGQAYYGDVVSFVAKGVPSLVITNKSVVYSKLAVTANVSVVPSSAVVYYRLSGSADDWATSEPINVGIYDVKVESVENDTYYDAVLEEDAALTITAKLITVTAEAKSSVYGESEVALTYEATSLVDGDSFSGNLQRAEGIAVGTYAIAQGTLMAGANYDLTYVGADYKIGKKGLTVTADNQTKVYGEGNPSLTFQYFGFVDGEDKSMLDAEPTAYTNVTVTSNVGDSVITLLGGVDINYDFNYVNGVFSITKAEGDITWLMADTRIDKATTDANFTLAAASSSTGVISYTSDDVDVLTVNSTSGEVSIVGRGDATITATALATNNHTEVSATMLVSVSTVTQMVSALNVELSLVPNPAQRLQTVILTLSHMLEHGSVTIYSLSGHKILTQQVIGRQTSINTSRFVASGIYLVYCVDNDQLIAVEKLVIR